MQLPHAAVVAVTDGEKLHLFRNSGEEAHPKLDAMPAADITSGNTGSGGRHQSSSANHDGSQQQEDNFSAGVAAFLNRQVLDGEIKHLVIIAAPRTLGELRKHYHKTLSAMLVGEIHKDLTGHPVQDVEKAVAAG